MAQDFRKALIGYGVGNAGEAISYSLIATYYSLFLTKYAGFTAASASTIIAVSMVIEVFAGFLIGSLSDHCQSPQGRRHPYILAGSYLLSLSLILSFLIFPGRKLIYLYYFAVAVAFRVFFSLFQIPLSALGAEITDDYNQRSRLRASARLFAIFGSSFIRILPLQLEKAFPGNEASAWRITGIIAAVLTFLSIQVLLKTTKERPWIPASASENKISVKQMIHGYYQLLKLRAMRLAVVYKAAYSVVDAIFDLATIYYLLYFVKIDANIISYLHLILAGIYLLILPLVDKMAFKMGKNRQQMITFIVASVVIMTVFLLCRKHPFLGVIIVLGQGCQQASFWQLSNALYYDVVEVGEYRFGTRQEGEIGSFMSVLGTAVTAITVAIFGVLFDEAGYNGALPVQPDSVATFLWVVYAPVTVFFSLVAAKALHIFPITRKSHEFLKSAIVKKRHGEELTVEDAEAVGKMV
ncbi:MAG: MFS transporter [Firmicutes bacterium]|nr:MFS transporter [Bacillota bacterium]